MTSDEDAVLPCGRFYIDPKNSITNDQEEIRTKPMYFQELKKYIGTEVAIRDAESGRYITSRGGWKPSRTDQIYKCVLQEDVQYFLLQRNHTGAFTFKTICHDDRIASYGPQNRSGSKDKENLYFYKSQHAEEQAMGDADGNVLTIQKYRARFSDKEDDDISSASSGSRDWVIEPVLALDWLPMEQGRTRHGSLLFLGVVKTNANITDNEKTNEKDMNIDIAWHFDDVASAWRSNDHWNETMDALLTQHRGEHGIPGNNLNQIVLDNAEEQAKKILIEIDDQSGMKKKWFAMCGKDGMVYVAVTTINFHQELVEECLTKMMDMDDQIGTTNIHTLSLDTQIAEIQLTDKENEAITMKQENETLAIDDEEFVYETAAEVPISLLHRCKYK